jgi:hypothetical protein
MASLPFVMAMFRKMLEEDRTRAGWSVGQAAWRPGMSIREYRGLEAGERTAELGDDPPDLRAVRLAADVPPALDDCVRSGCATHRTGELP